METVAIPLFAAPTRRDARRSVVDSRCIHYSCSVDAAKTGTRFSGDNHKSVDFFVAVLTVHGLKRDVHKSKCEIDASVFDIPIPRMCLIKNSPVT